MASAARALATQAISGALIASGALADGMTGTVPDATLYPAAQCAALWYGFDDYARLSAFLDRHEGDLERADAFRAVAYRLDDGATARVDAFVAEQRRLMTSLIEAMIYGGDDQSRETFDRLSQICESFAAQHPETKALR